MQRSGGHWARQACRSEDFLSGVAEPLKFGSAGSLLPRARLVASKVDGLVCSGLVDTGRCLPKAERALFREPSAFFHDGIEDVPSVVAYSGGPRAEYAALVVAQLRSRKVALTYKPRCSAATFVVAKRGTDRLREVWDGSAISEASVPPSAPRWLADPAALVALEASPDAPLYLSTRDGACFFDQLALETPLIPFFGRPQLQVHELADAGLELDAITELIIDDFPRPLTDDSWLAPVNMTWPMGFAHSTFGAQEVMTASCLAAGFRPSQFLTSAGTLT